MNPRQAKTIAARVTDDLDLHPPLSADSVAMVADCFFVSFALRHYPEELHAPIESRVLQEAEDG